MMRDMMDGGEMIVGYGNRLADHCGCRGAPDCRVRQIRILPMRNCPLPGDLNCGVAKWPTNGDFPQPVGRSGQFGKFLIRPEPLARMCFATDTKLTMTRIGRSRAQR
jgi:hypothetical protein